MQSQTSASHSWYEFLSGTYTSLIEVFCQLPKKCHTSISRPLFPYYNVHASLTLIFHINVLLKCRPKNCTEFFTVSAELFKVIWISGTLRKVITPPTHFWTENWKLQSEVHNWTESWLVLLAFANSRRMHKARSASFPNYRRKVFKV